MSISITITAETPAELEAQIKALAKQLEDAPAQPAPAQTRQATQPATGANARECPTHHKGAITQNGKLYCPTKLPDGSWCPWTAAK